MKIQILLSCCVVVEGDVYISRECFADPAPDALTTATGVTHCNQDIRRGMVCVSSVLVFFPL